MASVGSQDKPQSSPGTDMDVDRTGEKRKATGQEDIEGTPAEQENPLPQMSLDDLVRYSITQNDKRFNKLDRDMDKIQKEGADTKRMAARAVTSAEEAKTRVDQMEKRLAALETKVANPTFPTPGQQVPQSRESQGRSDWRELGGEQGDTVVLGGFRENSTADDRRTELEEILRVFPEELSSKISTRIIPETRTNIVLLKLTQSPEGPVETRRAMMAWCKRVKEMKCLRKIGDEEARVVSAWASKPFHVRQRDARTYCLYETLKSLFPEPQRDDVTLEISTGRTFYQHTAIANRPRGTTEMHPILTALQKFIPDLTSEQIKQKQAEVEKERERARASR